MGGAGGGRVDAFPISYTRLKMKTLTVLLLTALLATAAPVPLIFDTDMGNDIDDALALAVIHALESRGEAKLLAVTLTKDNRWSGPFVDLVNHFYGRPGIPIGISHNGPTPKDADYTRLPSQNAIYKRKIQPDDKLPEGAAVIRKVLESQPDNSVVIVQVGFSTNLARLLAEPGGRELAARKVKLLSVMAGQFPTGKPEYNVRIDVPSARKVFADWPGAIVFSGFEIGLSIKYQAVSIEKDFGWVPNHPVADAYRAYQKMPYDRPTWDLTSVLYAVRPDRGYFGVSDTGTVTVADDGQTQLEPSATGKHRYLTVTDEQRARVLEALTVLASQPRR